VTAEIIVIVEDQDARGGTRLGPIEIGRGEPADAATDDDQIVILTRLDRPRAGFGEGAVAQPVCGLEAAGMAAPQSGESGRVIAGTVLRG